MESKTGLGDDTVRVEGSGSTIDLGGGNNRIYVQSKGARIYSGEGNDRYEVKKLGIGMEINDSGGEDELAIGSSYRGINILYDVEIDEKGQIKDSVDSGISILSDKELKGYKGGGKGIQIKGYFGEGSIERIYSKEGWYITSGEVEVVRNQVACWLNTRGYMSSMEVYETGSCEEIKELLSVYGKTEEHWLTSEVWMN